MASRNPRCDNLIPLHKSFPALWRKVVSTRIQTHTFRPSARPWPVSLLLSPNEPDRPRIKLKKAIADQMTVRITLPDIEISEKQTGT